MFSRRCFAQVAAFAVLAALVGCSKNDGTYATVSGVVTHNGTPVEGAKITFHGTVEVDGKTPAFAAMTDSSGKYAILSVGKEPGIPPGMYKVTVTKLEGKGITPGEGMDAGQLDAMASDTGAAVKGGVVNLLPKQYSTAALTKLSVTLEAGKNEGKDFPLTGK
jgi:hypothetical protein